MIEEILTQTKDEQSFLVIIPGVPKKREKEQPFLSFEQNDEGLTPLAPFINHIQKASKLIDNAFGNKLFPFTIGTFETNGYTGFRTSPYNIINAHSVQYLF